MWWPKEEDLKDLSVEETDDGFAFSAPEGSECARWLDYFDQTEELKKEFKESIMNAISNFINAKDEES